MVILGNTQALGYDVEVSHHDIYGAPEFETDAVHLREIKTYYEACFLQRKNNYVFKI